MEPDNSQTTSIPGSVSLVDHTSTPDDKQASHQQDAQQPDSPHPFSDQQKAEELLNSGQLSQLFRLYDTNSNGSLDLKEAEKAIADLYVLAGQPAPSAGDLRITFQYFDSNKNGRLYLEEFISLAQYIVTGKMERPGGEEHKGNYHKSGGHSQSEHQSQESHRSGDHRHGHHHGHNHKKKGDESLEGESRK